MGQDNDDNRGGGNMSFRLIDTDWSKVLVDAIQNDHAAVRLVCPFIKLRAIERLLANVRPGSLQVITRFDLNDFARGVSDLSALRLLLEHGTAIRGVQNLHAKLYLFGDTRAIVTSANLTLAALDRNHEFGFVAEDAGIVGRCRKYFDDLWSKAGADLTAPKLAGWEVTVAAYLASGACPTDASTLPNEGVNAGLTADPVQMPVQIEEAPQAFVKFFGTSTSRADRSKQVFEELRRSGSHRACTYPKGKRPRGVQEGAILFMGRLVKDPDDIVIYGRAIGMRHEPGRDDATAEDIAMRSWKADWPHYIRVHHAEFLAGTLANGISLNDLMTALGSEAFMPTQRNAAKGDGNTDPRRAYMQQAAVELTPQANAWLNERLEAAYRRYGKLAPSQMGQLDWPATLA